MTVDVCRWHNYILVLLVMNYDVRYMKRALELAARSRGYTSPNPMVGAVIVSDNGQIIGEGWHRMYGGAHAEVHAVNMVTNKSLLRDATIYVTLEPCAHYGKTPPCAKLLMDVGIKRVVVATEDPFVSVAGKGIDMLRDAGAEVIVGVMKKEAQRLNAKFFTAHTQHRPWVTLKWAMSADGFIDHRRSVGESAAKFSTPLSSVAVHRLRADYDAIVVGARTAVMDKPQLNVRLWHGRSPRPIVFSRGNISVDTLDKAAAIYIDFTAKGKTIQTICSELYKQGITSLLIEGGATTLQAFIDAGIWDLARVETAGFTLGENGAVKAPILYAPQFASFDFDGNKLEYFSNNTLNDVKNL